MPTTPPAGWTKGLDVTIAAGQIPTTITDCPVVFTASAFTSTFLDALKADASDLRFTSDTNGTTFIPREIQHFDQVAGEIIVHVQLDSVTASTAKTIYAWANNASAEEPLPRDVSGAQSVWNNVFGGTDSYYGICHFQKSPTSGTLFPSDTGFKAGFESSGNWTPVNNDGNVTAAGTGPLPGQDAWELDNSDNITNLEAIDTQNSNSTRAFYLEFWGYYTSFPNSNGPIFVGDFNRFLKFDSNGKLKFGDSGNASTNGGPTGQWNQFVMRRSAAGNVAFHLNGATNGTTSTTQDIENMNRIFQDRNNTGNGYSGMQVCWWRVCRGVDLGGDHLAMQYNSVNNYLTFASAANETDFPASVSVTITVIDEDLNPIQDAIVYIEAGAGGPATPGTIILNAATDVNGVAEVPSYSYTGDQPFGNSRVVRGSGNVPYEPFDPLIGTIGANGFETTVVLTPDE